MSTAASILSGILFAAALALYLRGVRKGGLKNELNRVLSDDFRPKEYIAVLMLCLGSLLIHLAVASGIRLISGRNDRVIDALRLYSGLDSSHYLLFHGLITQFASLLFVEWFGSKKRKNNHQTIQSLANISNF